MLLLVRDPSDLLAFACFAAFTLGLLLYLIVMTMVFLRWTFQPLEPDEADPPAWIAAGAVAITVLAGSNLLTRARVSDRIVRVVPFLEGVVTLAWATATFWFPLMIAIGVWRHIVRRVPLRYTPAFGCRGGLKPIANTKTVNSKSGEVTMTDGPYAETKEVPRRLLDHRRARPRRRGRSGRPRRARRAWAPSRFGRSRANDRLCPSSALCRPLVSTPLISSGSSVPSLDIASPSWSVSSVTSTSPKTRSRRRSWSPRRSGGRPASLPIQAGGSPRPPATE